MKLKKKIETMDKREVDLQRKLQRMKVSVMYINSNL